MNSRLMAVGLGLGMVAGCGVKKTQQVTVPVEYREARTASRTELIDLVNRRYAAIRSLTVPKFKIQLTGGTIEDGVLEKYRDAGGYLVAQRDDSIFVNILNPLTNSSVLTMASTGRQFQVWIPSRNQFVTGATNVAANDDNPLYNVRPTHILQGLLIEPLRPANPGSNVTHYEEQDETRKYYVVMVTIDGELQRRLWIERSRLHVVRQQYYHDSALVSDIRYLETAELEGRLVSASVVIDRPLEKYSVRLQLDRDELTLDSQLDAADFIINEPRGAERIVVSDKQEVSKN